MDVKEGNAFAHVATESVATITEISFDDKRLVPVYRLDNGDLITRQMFFRKYKVQDAP